MTQKEFKSKVARSKNSQWLLEKEITIDLPHVNFNKTYKGVTGLFVYVDQQARGWEKFEAIPPVLGTSKSYFESIKNQLEILVDNYADGDGYNLTNGWRQVQQQVNSNMGLVIPYNFPEADFLIELNTREPNAVDAAFNFITGERINNINDRNTFIGYLSAYEFISKDHTSILDRRSKEKASISRIRNDFDKYLEDSEKTLQEHLSDAKQDYENYVVALDDLKKLKDEGFEDWFSNTKGAFNKFDDESKSKITQLQDTYEKLLSLEKPAEYWNRRAKTLKKEGWRAIYWLTGLVAFACVTLYCLLWLTPEGMLLSFINGDASAIKWSVVYITFISFLAFGIRALNKVAFSSFHLARDAEEREHLTFVFLAMNNETKVSDEDRNLILQSLFSRADTGLLKDDSSPTMPNTDTITNVIGRR